MSLAMSLFVFVLQLFHLEQLKSLHSFNGISETDWITYFFCTVLAITRDDDMNFDGSELTVKMEYSDYESN